jgi:hypothetical protein
VAAADRPKDDEAARHRRGRAVDLRLRVDESVSDLIDAEAERSGLSRRAVVEAAVRAQLG